MSQKPLTKLTVRFWSDDVAAVQKMCDATGNEFNSVVRHIFHDYRVRLDALTRRKLDEVPPLDLNGLDLQIDNDDNGPEISLEVEI